MHEAMYRWVSGQVAAHGLSDRSVLEVGSYNVNGSIRALFTGPFLGVDMRPGPGVDQVANGNALPFPDDSFAVVLCLEMLEHDERPWLTVPELGRVLAPGGTLLLTARAPGFPRHDHPDDHWRFDARAIAWLLASARLVQREISWDPTAPGVFALATKR